MKVDLYTDENEQKITEELSLRLGFGVDEVKKANQFMTDNLNEVISFDVFAKHLNN